MPLANSHVQATLCRAGARHYEVLAQSKDTTRSAKLRSIMGNNLLGSYGKVSSDSVADFEQEAGLRLPESYRRFLLETNGGRPERGRFFVPEWPGEFATVHVLWGIHEGKSSNLLWWKRELQDSLQDQHLAFGVDLGGELSCGRIVRM